MNGTAPSPEIFDGEAFLERLGGEREMVPVFLEAFLSDLLEEIKVLEWRLGEMRGEDIRGQAHKIKGIAGNMGALRLQNAAEKMEHAESREDLKGFEKFLFRIKKELQVLRGYLKETGWLE